MQNLLKINLLLLASLLSQALGAQSAEGNFIQNIHVRQVEQLHLPAAGNLAVKSWNGNYVRVEIFVELQNGGQETLRKLAAKGRYSLRVERCPGKLWLSASHAFSTINAGEPVETVRYVAWVPAGIQVEVEAGSLATKANPESGAF